MYCFHHFKGYSSVVLSTSLLCAPVSPAWFWNAFANPRETRAHRAVAPRFSPRQPSAFCL